MRSGKSLAEFAEAKAAERLKTLRENLQHAGKHPGHDDPVHDLRVSIRRFTQALRVFKDLWEHAHYRKMRKKLRKWMDLCGEVRNCDIAFEVLKEAGAPAAGSLETYLRKRRSRAEEDLAHQIHHSDSDWENWLRATSGKNRTVEARTRKIVPALRRLYRKAGTNAARPRTSPAKLHELRLEAKRLRYTLEIFGSWSGPGWEREIEQIKQVQELLGAVNDCVTSLGLIDEYGRATKTRRSKAALTSLLKTRVAAFREHWRSQRRRTN